MIPAPAKGLPRVAYDAEVDAAYIHFVDHPVDGLRIYADRSHTARDELVYRPLLPLISRGTADVRMINPADPYHSTAAGVRGCVRVLPDGSGLVELRTSPCGN